MSTHETDDDPCPHGDDHKAAPELDDYETETGTVVIYSAERPLGWIEIDPDTLVEVRRP